MSAETGMLLVTVGTDYESDAGELYDLARSLRRELLNTDVEDVRQATAATLPSGAKAAAAAEWATLLVTLADYAGLAAALFGAMTAWLQRNRGTELRLEIPGKANLTLKSSEIDQAAFDKFVSALRVALDEKPQQP